MSDDRYSNALQRLERLGGPDTGTPIEHAAPPVRSGSPGAQMLLSMVLPGTAALGRRPVTALVLFLLGVAAPMGLTYWVYSNRADLVGFALRPEFLMIVVGICAALVIVRLFAIFEIASWFKGRRGIGVKTAFATFMMIMLAVPVLWVGWQANLARGIASEVFASGDGEPLYRPEGSTIDSDAIQNILLLGSDAGPGRWGDRTDTMIVVSIHKYSGRTALVSIPRNLTRLQFPPGSAMHDVYPDGFTDLANAVFTAVDSNPSLVSAYERDGYQPHAVALAEGIGYSLDIEIDDYALVNMQGFADIIDAVGGVTIDVPTALPSPGDIEGVPAEIGPGLVDMDGNIALAFVRSRSADSDYQRMQRQRQLLAALGTQVSAADALRGFGEVTGALDTSMRTSLSAGEFSNLLTQLGDSNSIGESIGLSPPLVDPGNPDYDEIRVIMRAVTNYVMTGEPSGYAS